LSSPQVCRAISSPKIAFLGLHKYMKNLILFVRFMFFCKFMKYAPGTDLACCPSPLPPPPLVGIFRFPPSLLQLWGSFSFPLRCLGFWGTFCPPAALAPWSHWLRQAHRALGARGTRGAHGARGSHGIHGTHRARVVRGSLRGIAVPSFSHAPGGHFCSHFSPPCGGLFWLSFSSLPLGGKFCSLLPSSLDALQPKAPRGVP